MLKHLTIVVLAASCASGAAATRADTPPPATVREAVERAVDKLQSDAPAILVALSRAGERENVAFGEVREEAPFGLGTATQPFTALLVATHVAPGELDWGSTVSTGTCGPAQLSAFCFRGAATTWQHLVQHTAGLPSDPPAEAMDEAALQDFLATYELTLQPGARYRASRVGYGVLGMSLERRARAPFADQLQVRVLAPLELESLLDPAIPAALQPSDGLVASARDLLHLAEVNLHPEQVPQLADAIRQTQRVSSDVETLAASRAALGWYHHPELDVYWYPGASKERAVFVGFAPGSDTAVVVVAHGRVDEERIAHAGLDVFRQLARVAP